MKRVEAYKKCDCNKSVAQSQQALVIQQKRQQQQAQMKARLVERVVPDEPTPFAEKTSTTMNSRGIGSNTRDRNSKRPDVSNRNSSSGAGSGISFADRLRSSTR